MANIVFDLDGTLIDSAPDVHGIANDVLNKRGCQPISIDETRQFIGNGASVFVNKMRAARELPDSLHAEVLDEFLGLYEDAVTLTVTYPNVESALILLKEQGHQLGICTNKPIKPCRAVLCHLNLEQHFDAVFGGDSLPVHKPDPAPLQAAFDILPESEHQIYVGDSEVDAETAQRAGAPFVLFGAGYRKSEIHAIPHTLLFNDFKVLPDMIGQYCEQGV